MTMKQLEERVSWKWRSYGTYDVYIKYRGKTYHCISHYTVANDDYQTDGQSNRSNYRTAKKCLLAFYNECKQKNNLI